MVVLVSDSSQGLTMPTKSFKGPDYLCICLCAAIEISGRHQASGLQMHSLGGQVQATELGITQEHSGLCLALMRLQKPRLQA